MKYINLIISLLLLCSCTGLSPVKSVNVQKYLIKYNVSQKSCAGGRNISIQIPQTLADAPFNTNNMFYSKSAYTIDQYSYSTWATLPQNIIHQSIEQSVSNSCLFNNTYSNTFITADYELKSKIITLKQNISNGNARAILTIQVQLINHKTNIIKNKIFSETSAIKPSPDNMAIGISNDLESFLNKLIMWLNDEISTQSTYLQKDK